MRRLAKRERDRIIERMLRDYERLELAVPLDLSIEVISGEAEGLYGLLAVNFLRGRIDAMMASHGTPFAMLDLGGSTAQIAVPNLAVNGSIAHVQSFSELGLQAAAIDAITPLIRPCRWCSTEHHCSHPNGQEVHLPQLRSHCSIHPGIWFAISQTSRRVTIATQSSAVQ